MNQPLGERCLGRWKDILPRMGVDARFLTGKHGPCPICAGRDRFRFDNKEGRGTWICSQCGAGDGAALVMQMKGMDFKEVAAEIEPMIESVPRAHAQVNRSDKSIREAMNRLWSSSRPAVYGDTVSRYLEGRGIRLTALPTCLRYAERCYYGHDQGSAHHPAMIAKVTAPNGTPSTIHRTYLTDDGKKAPYGEPRKLMPGKVAKGAAVRLTEAGPVLGIAEGIETALSASIIWNVPCWAAVNSAMLMAWEPPADVREIIVFADNDPKFGGQAAAYGLAHRLAAGRHINTRVEMPVDPGLDWNDVLQMERATS